MPPAEPTLAALPNPVLRYFLATRPPFLSVTLVSALIGLATAYGSGIPVHPVAAIVTVAFALVAHAGINVLNDYYDALNGTDAINTERVFPFTGGSRFIQNGVLSMRETAIFGVTLVVLVILAGIALGSGLFLFLQSSLGLGQLVGGDIDVGLPIEAAQVLAIFIATGVIVAIAVATETIAESIIKPTAALRRGMD